MPKLNLRDLFWLVLVVAMGLGWWADRRGLNRIIEELRSDLAPFRELQRKEMIRTMRRMLSE